MGRRVDLTGRKFGRLLVIEKVGKDKYNRFVWKCLCDCGVYKNVMSVLLTTGRTSSCGCLRNAKQGMSSTRFHTCWRNMISRCDDPKCESYQNYGGRGITYDPKWKQFKNFMEDMFDTYEDTLELDRIDNNGNYTKENCRWATQSIQAHGKRKRKGCSSIYIGVHISYGGKFQAGISINNKRIRLGNYEDEYSAAIAYDNASEQLYGDRPNGTTNSCETNELNIPQ